MNKNIFTVTGLALTAFIGFATLTGCGPRKEGNTLTNVSYDPTREFYQALNPLFEADYKAKTGKEIHVVQSHGGSGKQARGVVEGSPADVVTLALEHDITLVEKAGLIDAGWIKDFPNDSSPYTSSIVFLTRAGNPKGLKDWDDLIKPGVEIITPDPKSSGGACWNFLAALAFAQEKFHDERKEAQFLHDLFAHVSVMDSGARGATTTFVEVGKGDVLLAWENEAINTVRSYPGKYEIVSPSVSILAQPSVAVVTENVRRHNTAEAAKAYLAFLYTDAAQRLAGENGYRPSNPKILKEFASTFDLSVKLVTIAHFGGWNAAYEKYFDDDALFDQILK